MTPAALQSLLLDLLAPAPPGGALPAAFGALADADWQRLLAMAREHRVGPLLHRRLAAASDALPEGVRAALAAEHRRHALRSLQWQRDLLHAHQALAAAGIKHRVLKGPLLALQAYAEPALRPLRDLDLLVPRDQALRAFEALVAAGCTLQQQGVDPRHWLQIGAKHLPALRSAAGGTPIEVHLGLLDDRNRPDGAADPAEDPAFWAREQPLALAGRSVPGCAPTDLLFHLASHAVYGHAFDNGPLLLTDVERLLATQRVDWPLFWRQARQLDMQRGCALVLAMAEQSAGPLALEWPADVARPEAAVTADLRLLMLRSLQARREVRLHAIVGGRTLRQLAAFVLRRAFVQRSELAAHFGSAADARWGAALQLARWGRGAGQLLRGLRERGRDRHFGDESARLARLHRWLQQA